MTFCKELFPVVDYSFAATPAYPSGQIGFLLCCLDPVSAGAICRKVSTKDGFETFIGIFYKSHINPALFS